MKRVVLCTLVLASVLPVSIAAAQTAAPTQPRSDILRLVSQTPVVAADGDYIVRVNVTGAPPG